MIAIVTPAQSLSLKHFKFSNKMILMLKVSLVTKHCMRRGSHIQQINQRILLLLAL